MTVTHIFNKKCEWYGSIALGSLLGLLWWVFLQYCPPGGLDDPVRLLLVSGTAVVQAVIISLQHNNHYGYICLHLGLSLLLGPKTHKKPIIS